MSGDTDIGAQISKLLADPAAMSQIMSVAGQLMNTNAPSDPPESAEPAPESPPESPSMPSMEMLMKLASGIKPSKNDPRCALLSALKPYLNESRRERVDALIQAISLSGLAGEFLHRSNGG